MTLKRESILLFFLMILSARAEAGLLFSPEMSWSDFSFRSEIGESRPNYYGIARGGLFGFSVMDMADLAAFGSYLPAHPGKPVWNGKAAILTRYGGQINFRFHDSMLVGLRGGRGFYEMGYEANLDNEVSGKWSGQTGSLIFGGLIKIHKKQSFQISTELMHMLLAQGTEKKRLDALCFSFSYVFNGFLSQYISDKMFNSLFN